MKIMKIIDRFLKGKKILLSSAVFLSINGFLIAAYAIDLAPYIENLGVIAAAFNTIIGAAIAIFRMAQADFRGDMS